MTERIRAEEDVLCNLLDGRSHFIKILVHGRSNEKVEASIGITSKYSDVERPI